MANRFIYRARVKSVDEVSLKYGNLRADRLGEVSVIQRRGICIPLNRCIVDDFIKLISSDSGTNMGGSDIQDFSRKL